MIVSVNVPVEVMSYPLLVKLMVNTKHQTVHSHLGQLRTEWTFLQQKRLTKALNGNSQRPDVNHST